MLGRSLRDPDGLEGAPGEAQGLGLLEVETELSGDKTLVQVAGKEIASGEAVRGYEMHVGATQGPDLARPMLELSGRPEGAVSADGRVMGCYLHGIFAADGFRHAFLSRLRDREISGVAYEAGVERTLDLLAEHLETHLDLDGLLQAARGRG
jgi:adenosylcobyric acid synthase